jgi:hypothetical protein
LNSIYHTRITYPKDESASKTDASDPEIIKAEKDGDLAG